MPEGPTSTALGSAKEVLLPVSESAWHERPEQPSSSAFIATSSDISVGILLMTGSFPSNFMLMVSVRAGFPAKSIQSPIKSYDKVSGPE